jgi:hypothetical protein
MCSGKIVNPPRYLLVNNCLDTGGVTNNARFKRSLVLELDPDVLDLSEFVVEGRAVYRLLAFADHEGEWAKMGHDIAYVRDGSGVGDQLDDSQVYRIGSTGELMREVAFGQQYLYLYQLVDRGL